MTREWNTRQTLFTVLERAFWSDQSPTAYPDETCYGDKPDVLVWGDSFSAHLYPGLSEAAEVHQLTIAQASLGFCPPISGVEVKFGSGCPEFNKHVLEMIRSRPPRDVILSAMWTLVTERDLPLLRETIAQVQRLGPHVIVVGPSPQFEFGVSQLYFRLASGDVTQLSPKLLTTVPSQAVSDRLP